MLTHKGVAAVCRHQQAGLNLFTALEGEGHLLLIGRNLAHPSRTADPDIGRGRHRPLQLMTGSCQLDHLAQRGQTVFGSRQASLTEVAPIRDMNLGNGGAMGGKQRPESASQQRITGTGRKRNGAGVEP